jgi:4,5:9,10-diseco-3-hydroxy-5,9,17-trioxoandrosta-1(10),2-diene-4-oate hydrolase
MNIDAGVETGTRVPAGEAAAYGPAGRSRWLNVDWRAHQRWLTIDGQPVNTIELGPEREAAQDTASQPLVFVHGLSGCWANWLEQLPVLAAEHRVITLDLPGFGYSPMPTARISISGYARLLDRLLGELGIDAAAVVGNSMGGFIAAELAIAFPQRVERLVLISAAGVSTTGHHGTARAVPVLRRLDPALARGGAWVAAKSDVLARRARVREALLSVVVRHPSRLPPALAAAQLRGAGKPGFLQSLEAVLDYDIRERLPEIACPTLIVWGDGDRLIPVRDADVFAELIGNSRKVIFEDTGHMAMLERPAAFNALLNDFLAE